MNVGLLLGDVEEGAELPTLEKEVKPVTVVLGAMASRDWRPQHHDYKFATEKNGLDDIMMNTPNLAAWFERYLTDWSGPKGRLARIRFRMRDSVYPGETMQFSGRVTRVEAASGGTAEGGDVGWVEIAVELTVGDKSCVGCEARMALPATPRSNPWTLKGGDWQP